MILARIEVMAKAPAAAERMLLKETEAAKAWAGATAEITDDQPNVFKNTSRAAPSGAVTPGPTLAREAEKASGADPQDLCS